jgi:riboflavin synthase
MFTGIITEIGTVENIKRTGGGAEIVIRAPKSAKLLNVDDSVSINGACQTVISKTTASFKVTAVEETVKKSTLGNLTRQEKVNLELAMQLNGRLGGHLVLGHVDCVGKINKIKILKTSWLFSIKIPASFIKYIIPVGSLAVEGVSLTVTELQKESAVVSIIPHTYENTVFKNRSVNDPVNLEFDILGKYIERLIGNLKFSDIKNMTEGKLRSLGF